VVIAAVWTITGLFLASEERSIALARGAEDDAATRTIEMTVAMVVWALLTPPIIGLVERVPLAPPRLARNAAILLSIGILIAALHAAIQASVPRALEQKPFERRLFVETVADEFHFDLLFFLAIAGLTSYVHVRRTSEEQRQREAQAEANLADARLRRMRADLQPHFLFNTLNDVAALASRDGAAAAEAMFKLADLLERSAEAERPYVRVSEELDFIRQYLDLEKLRFGSRLETRIEVDDPQLLGAWIPPLLVQPLVENSIVHGIRKLEDGGTVTVRASRDGGALRFEVRDSGPGCDPLTPFAHGNVGVTTTVARLDALYGTAPWLRYRHEGGDFVAELRVPAHQP
jgi:two-component system, LytTR family, sensor kinase